MLFSGGCARCQPPFAIEWKRQQQSSYHDERQSGEAPLRYHE